MTRAIVRSLKQSLRSSSGLHASAAERQLGKECALALLDRSIHFGHGRLAVIRLAIAVEAGAVVPTQHWAYCSRVAQLCEDRGLQEMFGAAALKAAPAACNPGY
jgi:hypothetical protein